MAYRLKLEEALRTELRRIGVEEIDKAAANLRSGIDVGAGVHAARKGFKRLRSLLMLARPALAAREFSELDRSIVRIARSLSGARDAQALLECVVRLERQPGSEAHSEGLGVLRGLLEAERARAEASLDGRVRAEARRRLAEMRRRLAALEPTRKGHEPVLEGLEAAYADARRWARKARRSGRAEDFHEWRKYVQRHWRHMQLLQAAWPEAIAARIAAARELSEILGQDHDLHVLRVLIKRSGSTFSDPAHVKALRRLCVTEQHRLRKAALPRGTRLLAEPPETFAARLGAYWRVAPAIKRRSASNDPAADARESSGREPPAAAERETSTADR